MKIALKASNGLYLTAENGGGIDGRLGGIALRARGTQIDAWQQFVQLDAGDDYFTLQTSDGYFVTAEGGGGGVLRTDAVEAGPWEKWREYKGRIICWDGVHLLT